MKKYCFYNGEIIDFDDVSIRVDDLGFLRGYGVFEVLRTFFSKPFLLDWHLDRFESSLMILGIKKTPSREEIVSQIEKLINLFPEKDVTLRIIATGGKSPDSFSFVSGNPTFLIIAEEVVKLDSSIYQNGVALFPIEYERALPKAKTLNYILPIKIKAEKEKEGFFDILCTSGDLVLESSTSNFFLIKDGSLITAKEGVLMGTTRRFVMDISQMNIEERDVKFDELESADEAFITATNKDIIPVNRVGSITIGDGQVGDATKKLMTLFKEKVKEYVD
ncbi:MAG: aminotransferase class IV [Patescibacteria group bacterium]|nr:aminotransferase class IV [Patescibacteria group bacterium]